jgi:pilus assembly protein CpaE
MMEKSISIILRAEDGGVWKELVEIISSINGVRLQDPMDESPCDIFFMEVEDEPEKAFFLIQRMQSTGKADHFFLTSRNASPDVLIRAIKMGVKEFFTQPIHREDVRAAILKIKNEKLRADSKDEEIDKKGKIINVFGTKGGIGTTTVAVNLASSLAALENAPSVVLVDLNLHFGDVPLFLGMEPVFDWVDVIKNISRLDKTYLTSILLKHQTGISVLPAPASFSDEYPINQQNLEELFKAMQHIFDYIVVDNGQSFDSIAKTVIRISDMLLLVTLLSLPCLINTRKLQSTLRHLGYPSEESIMVIANRFVKNSDISLKDGEKSINKKYFCAIPNDYDTTMRAINLGKPLRMMDRGSEISSKFAELASAIAGKAGEKKRGLFFRS